MVLRSSAAADEVRLRSGRNSGASHSIRSRTTCGTPPGCRTRMFRRFSSILRKNRPPGSGGNLHVPAHRTAIPIPLYRFYPGIQTGSGLSNQFGWRSAPITEEKPPRRHSDRRRWAIRRPAPIRAMVEHWLNLWAATAPPRRAVRDRRCGPAGQRRARRGGDCRLRAGRRRSRLRRWCTASATASTTPTPSSGCRPASSRVSLRPAPAGSGRRR